jgi:hypothetical protein
LTNLNRKIDIISETINSVAVRLDKLENHKEQNDKIEELDKQIMNIYKYKYYRRKNK